MTARVILDRVTAPLVQVMVEPLVEVAAAATVEGMLARAVEFRAVASQVVTS